MFDMFSLYDCCDLYSFCLKDAQGEKGNLDAGKQGGITYRSFSGYFLKGIIKPHHEAENCFQDFISKVHKVTKLEQVVFLNKFCSYKFQKLHHWICKPEILNTKSKTDTIHSLLCTCDVSEYFSQ